MKRFYDNNLQREGNYASPLVSVTLIEVSEILCSSKPGSDSIEDMITGDKFDNWI